MKKPAWHKCAAPGCRTLVAPNVLMCRYDWARVPPTLREKVLRAWDRLLRAAKEHRPDRVEEAKHAHFAAVKEAMQALPKREGPGVPLPPVKPTIEELPPGKREERTDPAPKPPPPPPPPKAA